MARKKAKKSARRNPSVDPTQVYRPLDKWLGWYPHLKRDFSRVRIVGPYSSGDPKTEVVVQSVATGATMAMFRKHLVKAEASPRPRGPRLRGRRPARNPRATVAPTRQRNPGGTFTSPKGRPFRVSVRAKSLAGRRAQDPKVYTVKIGRKEVGSIAAWPPSGAYPNKFTGSLSKLRFAGRVPPTGTGFDVGAKSTFVEAVAAWGVKADEILDWREGQSRTRRNPAPRAQRIRVARNRGPAVKRTVPASIAKTPRSRATRVYAVPENRSYPIGDLYHARLALIYAMSPTNAKNRRKVIRAVKARWPQYDWARWWNKERKGKRGLRTWGFYS